MVILYNVQWMSRKLKELQEAGHPVDAEVLKVLRRTGVTTSIGWATICWTCRVGRHHSIQRSISLSNQQLGPGCGGFYEYRPSLWTCI
jgi:hypothetical protein